MIDAKIARKVVVASLIVILLGVGLTVVEAILPIIISLVLSLLNFTEVLDQYMVHIFLLVKLVFAVLYFLLFFWSGIRAVKTYGLDIPMAGLVSALSAGMVAIFSTVLALAMQFGLINVIVSALSGIVDSGDIETALLVGAGGVLMFGAGVLATIFFGLMGLLLNMLLNFIVGALGGLFASK